MTRTEMLAYVRTHLDETSEAYYLDDEEIYPALAEAQREILQHLATSWYQMNLQSRNNLPVFKAINLMIEETESTLASGAYSIAVDDLIVPVSVLWAYDDPALANGKMCVMVGEELAEQLKHNSQTDGAYLTWWDGTYVLLNPVSDHASARYKVRYIKEIASDIDASTDPVLDEVAHIAICERALWVLMKDRELQTAQAHLQLYTNLTQGLMK